VTARELVSIGEVSSPQFAEQDHFRRPARLSLNTMTVRNWTLEQAVAGCERHGIEAIGPWRDRVAEAGVVRAAKLIRGAGLRVSTLCRGGFLTGPDVPAILDDNRRAIEEAATLGTAELVMVVGGLALASGDRDLAGARSRVADRLADLAPYAAAHGVRLVLEPLHPMYVADRAVISTLDQALDLCAPFAPSAVGVVVDTFHVWWDPSLTPAIARAGAEGRLASYQVCDWLQPIAADPLLSRAMMGDGVIDFASITQLVSAAGYRGDVEVEIFNADVWAADGDQVLARMVRQYDAVVAPYL
jgi:sugar phosphate isomerase/epimerase